MLDETAAARSRPRVAARVLYGTDVLRSAGRRGTEQKAEQVAIVRIEQLYPFAQEQVKDVLLRYPITCEVVWAQEEPRNMGPWRFMSEQMEPLL